MNTMKRVLTVGLLAGVVLVLPTPSQAAEPAPDPMTGRLNSAAASTMNTAAATAQAGFGLGAGSYD
jgi:hypothetical protein